MALQARIRYKDVLLYITSCCVYTYHRTRQWRSFPVHLQATYRTHNCTSLLGYICKYHPEIYTSQIYNAHLFIHSTIFKCVGVNTVLDQIVLQPFTYISILLLNQLLLFYFRDIGLVLLSMLNMYAHVQLSLLIDECECDQSLTLVVKMRPVKHMNVAIPAVTKVRRFPSCCGNASTIPLHNVSNIPN